MIMKKLSSIVLVGVAILLATASFSHAAATGGHGFSGHSSSGHFEGHRGFEGRRDFDRRRDGGVFVGDSFDSFDSEPTYSYYYYCPNSAAYYPTVPTCTEAWVPVPAE
jgi:hypothetical protein